MEINVKLVNQFFIVVNGFSSSSSFARVVLVVKPQIVQHD